MPARNNPVWSVVGKALEGNRYISKFPRSDPRVFNTFEAVSKRANFALSNAASISAASARPALITALRSIPVIGAGTVMAIAGLDWYFNDDDPNSVIVVRSEDTPELIMGQPFWNCRGIQASSPEGLIYECFARSPAHGTLGAQYDLRLSNDCTYPSQGSYRCSYERKSKSLAGASWTVAGHETVYYDSDGSKLTGSCPAGHYLDGTSCYPLALSSSPISENMSISDAVADIPAERLNDPLNPQIIAGLTNDLWQDAASQPGYDGLPFSPANAVLPQDIVSINDLAPSIPTVNDFVRPLELPTVNTPVNVNPAIATPGVIGDSAVSPSVGNGSNLTNPGASNPIINLGDDPNIGAPTLEQTPTASMIIEPLQSLFPDLKSYNASIPSGECPRPSFELFERSYVVSSHCDLLDDNAGVIQAAMLVAFGILSLLIVLRA